MEELFFRSHNSQVAKVPASFLDYKKDLLLQELPVFPGCGRHHLSLQMVLSMHNPRPPSAMGPGRGLETDVWMQAGGGK